jgi:predicted small secreted protein
MKAGTDARAIWKASREGPTGRKDLKMKTLSRLIIALMVCAMLGSGALGCNTFRGAGKDIQRGGESVENAADNAQR